MIRCSRFGKGARKLVDADVVVYNADLELKSDGLVPILVAEYSALRDEIGRYQNHQRQLFNSVFLVIGAFFTIGNQKVEAGVARYVSVPWFLATLPLVMVFLTMLYLDRAVRILRLAHYIHQHLRPIAVDVSGQNILNWEQFKRESKLFPRWVSLTLDRLRWSLFVVPIVVIGIYSVFLAPDVTPVFRWVAGFVSAACLLACLIAVFVTEETNGVVG